MPAREPQGPSEVPNPAHYKCRQRRAHTRSRTGCLVCRQRHKRCDEIFMNGACERCRTSGFECVPMDKERRYTYSKRFKANTPSPGPSELSSSEVDARVQLHSAVPSALPHSPTQPDSFPDIQPVTMPGAMSLEPGSSTSSGVCIPSEDLSDFITSLFAPLYPTASTQAPNISAQYAIPGVSNDLTYPTSGLGDDMFAQNMFYLPSSEMCIDILSQPLPPLEGQQGTSTSTPSIATCEVEMPAGIAGDMDLGSAWNMLIRRRSPKERGMESRSGEEALVADTAGEGEGPASTKWEDVAKRYQRYQESWYTRDPSKVTRSTRQHIPTGSPLQATTRGAVLEALQVRAQGHKKNDMGRIYYDFALSLLGEPGNFSLSDTMTAISDLQCYNFMVAGGQASYGALRVGEAIVKATMGATPVLDLIDIIERKDTPLLVFAQADIGHCLCSSSRKPIFSLTPRSSSDTFRQFPDIVDDQPYAIPLPIHEIVHQILTLPLQCHTPQTLSGIESSIRSYLDDPNVHPLWAHATMIILYQRLHRVGPLHTKLRQAAWDIITALPPQPCIKNHAFQLFLAGTAAIFASMREGVRKRWVRAPEKGFDEPMAFLELLWKEMDETGRTVDWVRFMEEKKMALMFF